MTQPKIVLDVGVGTNTSYKFNPHVTVDSLPIFMDIAVPAKDIRKWDWVIGDAQYLPFRDNSLDGIIASHVIEHLNDPLQFIEECFRVLKKEGYFEIRCPNFLSVNAKKDPAHKHVFNPLGLALLLKMNGFRVHFNYSVGSKLPSLIRKPLTVLLNLLTEEIHITAIKEHESFPNRSKNKCISHKHEPLCI